MTIPPENYLFRKNEVSKELYIIDHGSVELTDDDESGGEAVQQVLERGMMVGELGFLFGMRQTMHARTPSGSPSTVFGLDKNDFQQLSKLYPDSEEQMSKNMLEYWGGGMSVGGALPSARVSARASARASARMSARGSAAGVPGAPEASNTDARSPGGRSSADGSGFGDVREMLNCARLKKHKERVSQLIEAAAL